MKSTATLAFAAVALLLAGETRAGIPLLDSQPLATAECGFSNTTTTESADGTSIGVRQYGCTVNGVNAVFTVSIPRACATMACGLIVDQHGASMDAAQQNAGTHLRDLAWKATQRGATTPYVVIQPNLTDLFDPELIIDVGSVIGSAYSREMPVITQFVANAVRALRIDSRRIHIHGFSRGGFTANAYYCDSSLRTIFASYAASGSSLKCGLDRPMMVINGASDPNTVPAQATVASLLLQGATRTVVQENYAWWQQQLVWTWWGWEAIGQQKHVRLRLNGKVLEDIQHSGSALPLLGHCLPSTRSAGWLVCKSNFDIGAKVLDFFIRNPAPSV